MASYHGWHLNHLQLSPGCPEPDPSLWLIYLSLCSFRMLQISTQTDLTPCADSSPHSPGPLYMDCKRLKQGHIQPVTLPAFNKINLNGVPPREKNKERHTFHLCTALHDWASNAVKYSKKLPSKEWGGGGGLNLPEVEWLIIYISNRAALIF